MVDIRDASVVVPTLSDCVSFYFTRIRPWHQPIADTDSQVISSVSAFNISSSAMSPTVMVEHTAYPVQYSPIFDPSVGFIYDTTQFAYVRCEPNDAQKGVFMSEAVNIDTAAGPPVIQRCRPLILPARVPFGGTVYEKSEYIPTKITVPPKPGNEGKRGRIVTYRQDVVVSLAVEEVIDWEFQFRVHHYNGGLALDRFRLISDLPPPASRKTLLRATLVAKADIEYKFEITNAVGEVLGSEKIAEDQIAFEKLSDI